MNRNVNANTPAAKVTKVAKAIPHAETKAEVANDPSLFDEVLKRYTDAQDAMLKFFKAPTWKRTLVAFVTTILVGAGVGWIAGAMLEAMVVGAIAMAVPTFLILAGWLLGALIAIYYGGKLAARIGGAILTGEADERAIAAYDSVKSLVKRLNPFGARTIEAV